MATRGYAKYTPAQLEEALSKIQSGQMSLREAARNYPISVGTLSNKLKGKHLGSVGRPKALTDDEEAELVATLRFLADIGFGISKSQFCALVQEIVDVSGRGSAFKNGMPTKGFVERFMSRHPELSMRKAINLPRNRAEAITEDVIRGFFVNTYAKSLLESGIGVEIDGKLTVIKPHCLWNCDETCLRMDPDLARIIASKGKKAVHIVTHSNLRINYTIMGCGNAAGMVLPPHLVFKGERMGSSWATGGYPGASYVMSSSGWMEKPLFIDWIEKVFIPAAKKVDPGVHLLVFDGHSSHVSFNVVNLARKNHIHLVLLPPHTTSVLQPFDVGVFAPLKKVWPIILQEFNLKEKRINVEKKHMAPLVKTLWERALKMEHMVGGFRKSGLCPFDPEQPVEAAKNISSIHAPVSIATASAEVETSSDSSDYESESDEILESSSSSDDDILYTVGSSSASSGVSASSTLPSSTSAVSAAVVSFFQSHLIRSNNQSRGRGRGRGGFLPSKRYGESVTSDEAAERIRQEEETRKAKRSKKKEWRCARCNKKWSDIGRVKTWAACDRCADWYCGRCLPDDFDEDEEFHCENCS